MSAAAGGSGSKPAAQLIQQRGSERGDALLLQPLRQQLPAAGVAELADPSSLQAIAGMQLLQRQGPQFEPN